jgi:hypothetical protein
MTGRFFIVAEAYQDTEQNRISHITGFLRKQGYNFCRCNGCRAKQDWPGTTMLFWKVLGSLLVTLPLYWAMVTAFHLLNLPSDRAVLGGVCLLLATAAGGFVAFRKIWRM